MAFVICGKSRELSPPPGVVGWGVFFFLAGAVCGGVFLAVVEDGSLCYIGL